MKRAVQKDEEKSEVQREQSREDKKCWQKVARPQVGMGIRPVFISS